MNRVMVDLETLGREPGAAILSLGAVEFAPGGLGEELYLNISLQSCEEYGLDIEAETLEWWLDQDEEVQDVLTGGVVLDDALRKWRVFAERADEIWAYSPAFDCAILAEAHERTGVSKPWRYHQERDCRTLAALPQWPDYEQDGAEHDALADAKHQARCTSTALARLQAGDSDG